LFRSYAHYNLLFGGNIGCGEFGGRKTQKMNRIVSVGVAPQ
jgi:hypothetical protein